MGMALDYLSEEAFASFLTTIKAPEALSRPFLYETYKDAVTEVKEGRLMEKSLESFSVNHLQLIAYLVNEHAFYLAAHPDKTEKSLISSEDYETLLLSISLDKYYTNEHLSFKQGNLSSRFAPEISTIALFLNFVLGMLRRYGKGDPKNTLLIDLLNNAFSLAQCILSLLVDGFETEAFSLWRTLHENEAILQTLLKGGAMTIEAYLRHMRYAVAFRGGIKSKEETDAIFLEIKGTMREKGLKSKDMKRFIEYGWLYEFPTVKEGKEPDFRLNFRDGVERLAGLRQYAEAYEMASEIAHSSPLLIYSRKPYYYHAALLSLYESFFRLEKVFSTLYLATVSKEEKERYHALRNLYFGELAAAYDLVKKRFANLR